LLSAALQAVAGAELLGQGLVRPPAPSLLRRASGAEGVIFGGGGAVTWNGLAAGFGFPRLIADKSLVHLSARQMSILSLADVRSRERTFAFGGKADISNTCCYFCFLPQADVRLHRTELWNQLVPLGIVWCKRIAKQRLRRGNVHFWARSSRHSVGRARCWLARRQNCRGRRIWRYR